MNVSFSLFFSIRQSFGLFQSFFFICHFNKLKIICQCVYYFLLLVIVPFIQTVIINIFFKEKLFFFSHTLHINLSFSLLYSSQVLLLTSPLLKINDSCFPIKRKQTSREYTLKNSQKDTVRLGKNPYIKPEGGNLVGG